MTREEAIQELKYSIEMVYFNPLTGETSEWVNEENQRYVDACNVAIEALEQESILDKIRAEIEHLTITDGGEDYTRKMAELYSLKIKVLQIIDKYKAESEV